MADEAREPLSLTVRRINGEWYALTERTLRDGDHATADATEALMRELERKADADGLEPIPGTTTVTGMHADDDAHAQFGVLARVRIKKPRPADLVENSIPPATES